MNFLKENPLIAVLAVVALLVVGGGGYLVYQQSAEFSLAREDYDNQVANLHRLQNASPYPSEENLAAAREAVAELREALRKLETSARSLLPEVPDNITPQQFQDDLRQQVSAVVANAREAGVELPENFYLGFNQFQTGLPTTVEAPFLARQLQVIRWLVDRTIEAGVARIDLLERKPLPVEEDPANAQFPQEITPENLIRRNNILFGFSGEQGRVRRAFNEFIRAPQFLIIRSLEFRNSNRQAPTKGDEPSSASGATPTNQTSDLAALFGAETQEGAAPTTGGETLTIVLGREILQATFDLEFLDFAPLQLD
jgi:hypothetical protein